MPTNKKCPRCGCSLTLVALFSSFAEECSACTRGPLPFTVQSSKAGTKGPLIDLVQQFGLGIKVKHGPYTLIVKGLKANADTIVCESWIYGNMDKTNFEWPILSPTLVEIIE